MPTGRGTLLFLQPSKAYPSIDYKRSRPGCRGDTAKTRIVDVELRNPEIRPVQDIDCIQSKFKLLPFVDPDPLDEIRVETDKPGTFNPALPESSELAGRLIDKQQIALRLGHGAGAEPSMGLLW